MVSATRRDCRAKLQPIAKVGSGGIIRRRPGADTPRVYTTCMHALRTHFLPANGYCVLLRGSAAAAGAVWEAACALRGDYDTGFCALSAVLRVCDGAGAKAAAPMARAAMIVVFMVF